MSQCACTHTHTERHMPAKGRSYWEAGAAGSAGLRTQMVFLGDFVQKLHLNGFHYTTLNEPQPEPEPEVPVEPDTTYDAWPDSLSRSLPLSYSLVYALSSKSKSPIDGEQGRATSTLSTCAGFKLTQLIYIVLKISAIALVCLCVPVCVCREGKFMFYHKKRFEIYWIFSSRLGCDYDSNSCTIEAFINCEQTIVIYLILLKFTDTTLNSQLWPLTSTQLSALQI